MRRGSLEDRLHEVGAMATQLRLMWADLRPTLRPGEGPIVILVHGLYATAGVLRPLRRCLEQDLKAASFSFSYGFGPGIVELAQRVTDYAERVRAELQRPAEPVFLVGHSLGGLVATYAAHWGGLRGQVRGIVTLAAPFRGSRRAILVPGQAGRELEPEHPLLALLRDGPPTGPLVPGLAIVATDDAMIEPGSFPAFGEHAALSGVGHNGIVFDRRALSLTCRFLQQRLDRFASPGAELASAVPG